MTEQLQARPDAFERLPWVANISNPRTSDKEWAMSNPDGLAMAANLDFGKINPELLMRIFRTLRALVQVMLEGLSVRFTAEGFVVVRDDTVSMLSIMESVRDMPNWREELKPQIDFLRKKYFDGAPRTMVEFTTQLLLEDQHWHPVPETLNPEPVASESRVE